MYDTVLFDFDGTLTPSLECWLAAYRYALTVYGLEIAEDLIIQKCFYRPYAAVARDFNLPLDADFGKHVYDGLTQALATMQLFPSTRALLESCRQAGMALGLVTSSPRGQIEPALARLGISNYFSAVVAGGDTAHYKPHPAPVQLALDQLGKTADRALFVGDYIVDVLAGKAAGTKTALFMPQVHARFYSFEALQATEPDFIFTDHAELINYLSR